MGGGYLIIYNRVHAFPVIGPPLPHRGHRPAIS
jgi:hypothetical protein